ncbi:GHKL domain-containing protein [Alkalinema sp. FACHB-956]|nr:GHKL domain-containing protein [Alkalinema sp. FACHB-956]
MVRNIGTVRFELTSTISELKSWEAQLEIQEIGQCLIALFDEDPLLPGVVLTCDRHYQGMISRRHFFEQMSRPYSLELFSRHPLERFCEAWATEPLTLPGTTSIVEATQQGLQRSKDCLYEPILIEMAPGTYRVLDFHELLLAYSQVHTLSLRSLQQAQQEAQLVEENLRQLQYNYSRHLQTEKMAALGQLVAGVAHEINNPTSFIYGNLNHVDNYIRDFLEVIALYQAEYPQPSSVVQAKLQEVDFDFLASDIVKLVRSMRVGAERITEIVKSLRNFSRLDESDYKAVDIHDGIDSTLMILRSRLKSQTRRPEIRVTKDYGLLPLVECYAGQLNQVFMNILSNAIDAIEEPIEESPQADSVFQGQIQIRTQQLDNQWIMITIADNGSGIPENVQNQLFEPFFTTKAVGKGTGLGLYISHQIIREKHHGKLTCQSNSQGTEFRIQIPICQTRSCSPVRTYARAIEDALVMP